MDYDYSGVIDAAKADPSYFKPFARFTLRRTPDTIAVDTDGKTAHYPISMATSALNLALKEL